MTSSTGSDRTPSRPARVPTVAGATSVAPDAVEPRAAHRRPADTTSPASWRHGIALTATERLGARLAGSSLLLITLVSIPAAVVLARADDAAAPRLVGVAFLVVAVLDVAAAWGLYLVTRQRAGTLAYAAMLARSGYALLLATSVVILLWPGGTAAAGFRADWSNALLVFGLSLVLAGLAVWRSRTAPRAVALATSLAGGAYLLDDALSRWTEVGWRAALVPVMLGELALMAWLLVASRPRRRPVRHDAVPRHSSAPSA
ncbi:MAG: DUF4386 family protein [Dermatophilaceae bacterium]